MNLPMIYDSTVGIVILVIVFIVVLIVGFTLLFHFVFSRNSFKHQVKDLKRKYSYLDALLLGQVSQYIHRLEIISRTNLLYVDKYEEFSRRYKTIYENEDKYTDSMIKRVDALIAAKQYKGIKTVISDLKKAINNFEDKANSLDNDLYELIKPEEDSRSDALKLKENYRHLKQTFYANSNDLELVSSSFNKVFDKLDLSFSEFENHIESAEYEEANAILPVIAKVVNAIEEALSCLPNLCILVTAVIPTKIDELIKEYEEIEDSGMPLFNLSFKHHLEEWNNRLENLKANLVNLKTSGASQEVEAIQQEIDDFRNSLNSEIEDKKYFNENMQSIYASVIGIEKSFIKICAILPEVKEIYVIDDAHLKEIDTLTENVNSLGNTKRILDNFVHSNTRQPYSVLRGKLEALKNDYEMVATGVNNFKSYLESLKKSSEEAYNMIFVYYYRCKQTELILREINIEALSEQYFSQVETCYNCLNDVDIAVKKKPIDVAFVNEKVEELKNLANTLFEELESRYRECQLAESSIVYVNRDRKQQTDVHRQLLALENNFYNGNFVKVYHDASALYQANHVEENNDGK